MLLAVVTQVLEGPYTGDIRGLFNMLLDVNESVTSLQLCVARTTGAGSTPVVVSYDQCSFVSVRLFIV